MKNELYQKALLFFGDGKYEEALTTLTLHGSDYTLSKKDEFLIEECKKAIIEQYIYLINDYIAQEDYTAARNKKEEYESMHDFCSRIDNIIIPEKIVKEQITINEPSIRKVDLSSNKSLLSEIIIGIIALTLPIALGIMIRNKNVDIEQQSENNYMTHTEFKRYQNVRFGYGISYPTFLTQKKESENGDGCVFSKDSTTYLIVYGIYNSLNESLNDKYYENKPTSATYSRLKSNWFVISDYTTDGRIFYTKTFLKNDIFITATFYYPNKDKELFAPIVDEIFRNFSFLSNE